MRAQCNFQFSLKEGRGALSEHMRTVLLLTEDNSLNWPGGGGEWGLCVLCSPWPTFRPVLEHFCKAVASLGSNLGRFRKIPKCV